jgi:putative DNA methylase
LSGLTNGGLIISASWPIATEMAQRTNARGTASLMGSVHLVCRPRTEHKIGDWAEVLRELPGRVGDWMARLEGEGVRGADLVFACIGPALEIFSRYARVEKLPRSTQQRHPNRQSHLKTALPQRNPTPLVFFDH